MNNMPFNPMGNTPYINNLNSYSSTLNRFSTPYQMPMQNNGITWVQGIEGAKAYQMTPNSNAVLMDNDNEGIFYIKVSDNVGMCTLRVFSYNEITNTQPTNNTDMSAYVTHDELKTAVEEILGGMKNGKQSVSATNRKSADNDKQ